MHFLKHCSNVDVLLCCLSKLETVTKIFLHWWKWYSNLQHNGEEQGQNLLLLSSAIKIKSVSTSNKLDVLMFTVPHKTRSLNKWTSVKVSRAETTNTERISMSRRDLSPLQDREWLISCERCQTAAIHCYVLLQLIRSGQQQFERCQA